MISFIVSIWLQVSFKDSFNGAVPNYTLWDHFVGGTIVLPDQRIGDGNAASFHDVGIRLLQTVPVDLRFGESIQFIIHFQRIQHDMQQNVYLQCSSDNGN